MKSIEDEISDSSKKVQDVSVQLWQALLTVNGYLIAILIGIVALSNNLNQSTNYLIFWTVVALFTSSGLIILSFLITKRVLTKIYNVLYLAHFSNVKPETKNELFAAILGLIKNISEIIAIIIQVLSAVMIIRFLHFILYKTH